MATQAPLNWDAEALWLALEPQWPGLSVEVVAEIGSSNTELVARARTQADPNPCLLVAETQHQGRGRQGKTWHSGEAGTALMFSLALPYAPADWSGLSLAVGLALAEAIDPATAPAASPAAGVAAGVADDRTPAPGAQRAGAAGQRVALKWPNDLVLRQPDGPGRKLGGILIETVATGAQRTVVIGIGLNVRPQPDTPGLAWGRACLDELAPGTTAPQWLARLAPALLRLLRDFAVQGFAPLAPAYAQRDLLRGQAVTTTLADTPAGVADGVDARGMLWLRLPDGRRVPVGSGEVSLRLAAMERPPC